MPQFAHTRSPPQHFFNEKSVIIMGSKVTQVAIKLNQQAVPSYGEAGEQLLDPSVPTNRYSVLNGVTS